MAEDTPNKDQNPVETPADKPVVAESTQSQAQDSAVKTKRASAPEAPAEEKSAEPKKKPPAIWPLWLVLVLVVLAVAGAGYYGWMQLQGLPQFKQEIRTALAQTRENQVRPADVALLRQEIEQLNRKLSTTSNNLAMQQHALSTRLANTENQVLQIGGTTRTEWMLAEAEYLLRLANQRLNFEKDVPGAIAIMESADAVLKESGDAGSFGIREQLKKDILKLSSQALVDQDGIYLELEAMIGLIEQLDQRIFVREEAEKLHEQQMAAAEATEETPAEGWKKWWARLRHDLTPMLVFRKMDKPVEPLMSPEQNYYLKQNLHLMLEQAQLAMMKQNQPLYEKSLQKARRWVETYFETENQATRTLLKKLAELESKQVDPALPDVSKSLLLLKERLATLYGPGGAVSDKGEG